MRGIPTTRRQRQSAFTLIELMTVIGVIALLAGLILPALSASKKKAQQIHCINNVRQLGTALQEFLGDYHVYPLANTPQELSGDYPEHLGNWAWALEGELRVGLRREAPTTGPFAWTGTTRGPIALKNSWHSVWDCPSAFPPGNLPEEIAYSSYGYNSRGLRPNEGSVMLGLGGMSTSEGARPIAPPVTESEVLSPSHMMAIGDGFLGDNGVVVDLGLLGRGRGVKERYPGSTKHSYARHGGKADVVFCDGHTESPSFKMLFDDDSDAALRRWNRDDQAHRDRLGL